MKKVLSLPKSIIVLLALATAFILGRTLWSGSSYYLFLFWNLFLAYVPFLISMFIVSYVTAFRGSAKIWIIFILGILWLITFPNAPYLVTDVIHLGKNKLMPVWYDAMLLFSVAYIGMLFTFHSLHNIEKTLNTFYSKLKTNIFLVVFIFVSSFGIYLGRFMRWNSWDVFTNPSALSLDIVELFRTPTESGKAFMFTLTMLVFIGLMYIAWKLQNKEKN